MASVRAGHRPGDHRRPRARAARPEARRCGPGSTRSSGSTSRSPGWVEHDLEEIWARASAPRCGGRCAQAGARGARRRGHRHHQPARDHRALAARRTGRPVQPRHRLAGPPHHRRLRRAQGARAQEPWVRERTGLVLDPYFSATKLALAARPREGGARDGRGAARLAFGTIDTFLCLAAHRRRGPRHRRLQRQPHPAHGPRARARWDDELLDALRRAARGAAGDPLLVGGLRHHPRPRLSCPTASRSAAWPATSRRRSSGRPASRPARPSAPTAPAPSCCRTSGPAPVHSSRGLLTTVAWEVGGEVAYALEGSSFIAGAAVQWLRDGLGLIERPADDRGAGAAA